MNQVFLYGEIDLPPVPPELIIDTNNFSLEKWHIVGNGRTFTKNNKVKKSCVYAKWTVNYSPLIDWIKNNVPAWPEHENLTIQKNLPNENDNDTLFPIHYDVRRMFALNYILTVGGESVITSWFKHLNKPMLYGLHKTVEQPFRYEEVELLDSMQAHKGKWYLLRTNVLHDVDHIDSIRSAITIPYFDENIITQFKQRNLFKNIKEIDHIE